MKVIGLLGGVGSGKSTVAKLFAERGAALVDADRLGHEILELSEVRDAIRERFGDAVFDENGWILRNNLARIVFSTSAEGKQALADLEALTHPLIRKALLAQLETFRNNHTQLVILDAPLLLRAGWDRLCDDLVFVECPLEQRVERVAQRGWDREQLLLREAAQESLDEKRERCRFRINNAGDVVATGQEIDRLLKRWNATDSLPSAP